MVIRVDAADGVLVEIEVGDLRLLENGSERGGALVSDLILSEAVSEGWRGAAVREQACQQVLAQKRVHLREVTELPLSPSHSLVMPSVV